MAEQLPVLLPEAPSIDVAAWRMYTAKAGLAVGCSVLGAVAGTLYGATTPTDVQVGPHEAIAEVTFDNDMTLDAGVLGSLRLPDAGRFGLGGYVTLGEIPASESSSATDDIGAVVGQYEQLFSDPEQTVDNIKAAVIERTTNDGISGAGLGLTIAGLMLAGSNRMSDQRRAALRVALQPPDGSRKMAQAAALSTVVLASCTYGTHQAEATVVTPASSVFDGTALQGVEVSGRLLQLAINVLGPRVIGYIENVQNYYGTVTDNFDAAFEAHVKHDPAFQVPGREWIQSISDNHCNMGINQVHGAISRAFGVSLTIDSGDTTMSGTAAESECVSQANSRIDNPYVWIRGNHDSIANTQRQAEDSGMIVLDDTDTVEVAGLTIMGDGDPRQSTFGTPIHYWGDETLEDQADRVKAAACTAERPIDILVVHSPEAAEQAMDAGCATLSISGDTHELSEPRLVNDQGSYMFTEGSSGGAASRNITVGTLQAPAVQTIFGYNPETGSIDGYYVVTINTDQSVDISDYKPMPTVASTESSVILASD